MNPNFLIEIQNIVRNWNHEVIESSDAMQEITAAFLREGVDFGKRPDVDEDDE
jgi:hypothetical protein